jgi:hypothetical protein
VGARDVATHVATGDPGGAIVDLAARGEVDLIVMGVPHRSWLDRVLFGSTLRRVLRRATLPVLVVPVIAGDYTWPEPAEDAVARTEWTESAAEGVAA